MNHVVYWCRRKTGKRQVWVSASRPTGVQEKIKGGKSIRNPGNMEEKKREEWSKGKKRSGAKRQRAMKPCFIHTVSGNY